MSSQNQRLLSYLETNGAIDPLTAQVSLGIGRPASRIYDLRQMGHKIESSVLVVYNRFGEECRVARYELRDA